MGTGVMGIKMLQSITGLTSFILLLIKLSKNIWLCFSGTGSLERNYEVTFCPFHGQRRLVSYSLWDHKELDTTECTCYICSVVVGYQEEKEHWSGTLIKNGKYKLMFPDPSPSLPPSAGASTPATIEVTSRSERESLLSLLTRCVQELWMDWLRITLLKSRDLFPFEPPAPTSCLAHKMLSETLLEWRGVGERASWLVCSEGRFVSDCPSWKSECNFP